MRTFIVLILSFTCLAAGSLSLAQEEASAEPQALLDAAVELLQEAESFRLAIEQTGQPYGLTLSFDGVTTLSANLQSAEAQYINPGELYISTWLHFIISFSLDIYALDDRQWLSFPSGAPWIELPAFEGFDISRLMATGAGIEYALSNLQDPLIVTAEVEPDERDEADESDAPDAPDAMVEPETWHIRGRAEGEVIKDLLFGFIEPQDDVEVDATITVDDGRLVLIEITMLETVEEDGADPAVWTIAFSDYDAPRDFEPPLP